MYLIKDIKKVSDYAKKQWAGENFSNEFFAKYKWAIVDHPFTNWERIESCHKKYENAKLALEALEQGFPNPDESRR